METNRYIAYYDADCGVCSAFIHFAQKRISTQSIIFVPNDDKKINIQLNTSVAELKDNTIILFDPTNQIYHLYSDAVFLIFSKMYSFYKYFGILRYFRFLSFAFNAIYRYVAKRRANISKLLGLNSCRISS